MIQVRLAASLAALALVLVGCSDDHPEPTPEPTPSNTISTSTSPTPEPTPTQTESPLSAVQTVQAWVDARNETLRTGGATEIYALSTRDCSTCRDLVEPVRQLYADGGSIRTKGWIVERARERPDFAQSQQVAAALTFTEGRTMHPGGTSASPFPEEKHIVLFGVRQTAEGWLVSQVVFVP